MRRQFTGVDIAIIVFGAIMFILTIALFATAGSMFGEAPPGANYIQIGVACWYLVTSVTAIAAGATGHKGPYIAVIVLTILATLIALSAGVIAIAVFYWGLFGAAVRHENEFYGSTISNIYPFGREEIDPSKSVGVMAINFITFVVMIVLSSLGCAGSCCAGPSVPVGGNTVVVTTSGGYVAAPTAPPGYVGQPPQHNFQGTGNPNYNQQIAMESYKQ